MNAPIPMPHLDSLHHYYEDQPSYDSSSQYSFMRKEASSYLISPSAHRLPSPIRRSPAMSSLADTIREHSSSVSSAGKVLVRVFICLADGLQQRTKRETQFWVDRLTKTSRVVGDIEMAILTAASSSEHQTSIFRRYRSGDESDSDGWSSGSDDDDEDDDVDVSIFDDAGRDMFRDIRRGELIADRSQPGGFHDGQEHMEADEVILTVEIGRR